MNCLICDIASSPFATATVLHKYTAQYNRCPNCGLVFCVDPHWLPEAYKVSVNEADPWRDARAEVNERILHTVFQRNNISPEASCLDYGCGYGELVVRMRKLGYNFSGYDKYTAQTKLEENYDVVTCIEVIEHLTDPSYEFDVLAELSNILIVSTETISFESPPIPPNWWYYAVEWGQHITFYTGKALDILAKRHDMVVRSFGSHHLFTKNNTVLVW